MRIGGLASGMDIDQLVSDLMRTERLPLDKLNQQKQLLEWQRDDYREMNTLLKELDTFIFEGIDREGNLLSKTTVSSDDSVVTAIADSSASDISTEIEVLNLAKPATWISDGTANFMAGTNRTISLSVTNGDGTVSNNITVDISDTDTLDNVIKKLNDTKELDLNIFHDSETNKVVITSNEPGAQSQIMIDDPETEAFFQEIGFTAVAGAELGDTDGNGVIDGSDAPIKTSGEDAAFVINGLSTTRSSNEFKINGVSYTLKGESPGTKVSISTSTDTDKIVDTVVQFVAKYNEIIDTINGKLSESRNRDYPPLTNEQMQAMSETEIELWEAQAKSGLIRNDSMLSSGLNQLRIDLYSPVSVDNGSIMLNDLGINTTKDYLENGKLEIDEFTLREKIAEDPEAVYELFNAEGSSHESKGLATRLRDTLSTTMEQIVEKAGNPLKTDEQFSIGKNLVSIDEQIDSFEDRLIQIEDRYWRQFTAMEQAIQRANEQSAYLLEQFGGGY
ncbi:flagellar hook-associated protein 2 [Bacillus sp. SCS-151]|uniref:flagellar hook-associated protein 2 n=1 Tax=Nanhaiella sioensis TaxID=3115293 RepID=UPI00397DF5D7